MHGNCMEKVTSCTSCTSEIRNCIDNNFINFCMRQFHHDTFRIYELNSSINTIISIFFVLRLSHQETVSYKSSSNNFREKWFEIKDLNGISFCEGMSFLFLFSAFLLFPPKQINDVLRIILSLIFPSMSFSCFPFLPLLHFYANIMLI